MRNTDTIYAAASGSGKTAVRVLRISGGQAGLIADRLGLKPLVPRMAALRRFLHPHSGDQIDRGLALWFGAPHSYTGEDCLELHVHGGRAVQAAMFEALSCFPGCRMADPGEFTWRAFANGKMDLSAVEGLGDLIEAETELQRRQALGQAEGRLLRWAQIWKEKLTTCLSFLEGAIDFEDETDVPKEVTDKVEGLTRDILVDLDSALLDGRRGEIIRDGMRVVIAGPPNAGKSSLLNCLVKRDVAIVSASPGTTRDIIEITLDLDGAAVVLVDTAGLRETEDPVEAIGVARARDRAEQADMILWLSPSAETDLPDFAEELRAKAVCIRTKADLCNGDPASLLSISAVTGHGIQDLFALLSAKSSTLMGSGEPALITRARHRSAIARAAERLRAVDLRDYGLECAAEEVRQAVRELSSLFGGVDTEDVLGEIFSRFCVGK